MAVITSSKLIFLILGCFYFIAMVSCRPQNAIDSQVKIKIILTVNFYDLILTFHHHPQDSPDDNGFDMRQRLFNAYQNYPSPLSPEERMALNRMQYELMANYVQNR